ncbi:MAG: hypothetical protein JXL97_11480 [Bacteroidales bacterium]|nr:hypothetical protein [Bacteroidales bacterium]
MNLKLEIKSGINNKLNLLELRDILVAFEKNGGSQIQSKQILEDLRKEFIFSNEENKEDIVLELLDFVVGWCNESLKIWKD